MGLIDSNTFRNNRERYGKNIGEEKGNSKKIYETKFKPLFNQKKYDEAWKLCKEHGLVNYLSESEATTMEPYFLNGVADYLSARAEVNSMVNEI